MARSAIVVGSGAGGSAAAWALEKAGWDVLILEKGRHLLPGLGTPSGPRTLFGNDEVKAGRYFENQDIVLEPRTSRTQDEAKNGTAYSFIGDVNTLPTVVGGGTIHWDAKTPRFWKQDFTMLSDHGPVSDANVADWPLTYRDLAPFYDEVEEMLGVQGDIHKMPKTTLQQAPRKKQFPMPPNPPMYGGSLIAEGAKQLGYHAYPFPMAVNSRAYAGRPRCNSCGFCSGYGCPIQARGGAAVSFLHDALLVGARLEPRAFVYKVRTNAKGTRVTGVSYLDDNGGKHHASADVVILALSAIETARLLLMSRTSKFPNGLANRSDMVGRNLMFHFFTAALAVFAGEVHAWRGPSTTFTIDDFVGPEKNAVIKAAGLPYVKGGICEVGASTLLLEEAQSYAAIPNTWGLPHKELMRLSPARSHFAALNMVGEDLPQVNNRVDLDPSTKDVYGFPVPRITYSSHNHELVASAYYGPKLAAICAAAPGAIAGTFLPLFLLNTVGGSVATFSQTRHIFGTARMGHDPKTSVADAWGRAHDLDNLYLADGSVFPTSGGFNPSLTIMALSLRMARRLAAKH